MQLEIKKRIFLIITIFLMGYITACSDRTFVPDEEIAETEIVAEETVEEIVVLPPLIQATTLESDYRTMARLGLAATSCSEQGDLRQAYENVLCSCVRIQIGEHYGSGSIYRMLEDEIIIVTNRHVLQYWSKDCFVTFFNGAVTTGTLIRVSDEADLGFISIPVSAFTYQELLVFKNVRVPVKLLLDSWHKEDTESISERDKIFFIDIASDWRSPVCIEGEVIAPFMFLEEFQMEMLYGKGNAVPGMSGSGVFDRYGNYVGMITGGTLQGEIAAVPVEVIEEEFEKVIFNNLHTN
ncbi:MAG: serine protease [Lachnospiraceae bacterium]|nr:serine protease [Lachnospiraceae bacterium]